jgi:hypothetical protein
MCLVEFVVLELQDTVLAAEKMKDVIQSLTRYYYPKLGIEWHD